jgi:hypothetical protein
VPHPHPEILGALRLRRWALQSFATPAPPSAPPTVPEGSWRLFLAREGCALRLTRRLGPLAPEGLRAEGDREAQVVLALRAELQEILEVARGAGISPVILKGGATLDDPERGVGAKDIDLFLPAPEGQRLAALLDARGWRPLPRGGALHHLAERFRPGRPPVEIHTPEGTEVNGLGPAAERRAVAHPHLAGARLLAPADRVAHLAVHQAVQHVSHRGRIRDLLLLADALDPALPLPDPREWEGGGAAHRALTETLAMARSLAEGRGIEDRFADVAVLWYRMDQQAPARPGRFHRNLMYWIYDLFVADGAARAHWDRSWRGRQDERSSIAALRWLEAEVPSTARLRALARGLWLPPVIAAAWWKARQEREIARETIAALGSGA